MGNKRGSKEAAAERRPQALQLRIAGASYRAIGKQLGTSGVQAFRDVEYELKLLAEESKEEAERVRQLETERLDALLLALWPRAKGGRIQNGAGEYEVIAPDQGAVDRILRIMERRSKLMGLDAPVKQELTGKDGGPIEHEHRLNPEQFDRALTALADAVRDIVSIPAAGGSS
ncbi:MAG: hypothetical protein WC455_29385, partial [Dehalococcoidia bacterium]